MGPAHSLLFGARGGVQPEMHDGRESPIYVDLHEMVLYKGLCRGPVRAHPYIRLCRASASAEPAFRVVVFFTSFALVVSQFYAGRNALEGLRVLGSL